MKKLPLRVKTYLISIYLITITAFYFFIQTGYIQTKLASIEEIVFFGILAVLTESFTVSIRHNSFTTTFAITTGSYILFGPLTTLLVSVIGLTFCVFKGEDEYKHILNQPWFVTLFNYCGYALQIIFGNFIYIKLGGDFALNSNRYSINNNLLQIFAFVVISYLINWLIISILNSLFSNKNIFYVMLENIKLITLNSLVMLPFALILAIIFMQYEYLGVIFFIFPIILVRYTFSLYIQSKSQYVDTVNSLMRAMEARDKYTEGHSQRVAELVSEIARELKYNEWQMEKLNIASLLHDVGKIGIDDHILNKPGKLTEEEFNIIKSHAEIGYGILKDVKNLKEVIHIVRHHHERYDGKGYPLGKKADELSLDVFIVQLADSIDAMATDRPYRKALTQEQIIDELNRNSGTQFHPKVVEAYLNILKKQEKAV